MDAHDGQGRWLEEGRLRDGRVGLVVDSRTFVRNVELLSRYLAQERSPDQPREESKGSKRGASR